MFFAPCVYLFSYPLIQRTTVDQTILEFSTGWIGCFYQDKQTFVFFFADLDERFDAVRTEIRIDRSEILIKSCELLGTYFYFSQMTYRVGLGSRTDISTFYITDNYQSFFMAVLNAFTPSIPNCSYMATCGFTAGIRS